MLAGPLYMCALVLAGAGMAKLWSPHPTRAALYAMRLPSSTAFVVVMALVEVLVATSVVVVGGALPALALAAAYAGFAGFVATGVRSQRLTACGCFGRSDTPPGLIHIGFNLGAAAIGGAAAVSRVPALDAVIADQPWLGVPFVGLVVLGAALGTAVLTVLPRALQYVRPSRSRQPAPVRA